MMDVAVEGLWESSSEGVVTAADCAEPVGAWELSDSRSGVWVASALVSLTCDWGISRFKGRSCTCGISAKYLVLHCLAPIVVSQLSP